MGLQMKMSQLVVLMFVVTGGAYVAIFVIFFILYGTFAGIDIYIGVGHAASFILLAALFMGFQNLLGPFLLSVIMEVKYVSEKEEPELHRQVAELAEKVGIPKPKVGISPLPIPSALSFGKTKSDAQVCITQEIRQLLSEDELKAVLGHEIAHIKHGDMMIATLLSAIPLLFWFIVWSLVWKASVGDQRQTIGLIMLLGLGAMIPYVITNLLVLVGSRIREYYADEGSVKLGNYPHHLASALYKIVGRSAQMHKRIHRKEELHPVEGLRALFHYDIRRPSNEIEILRAIDRDHSGTIDQEELLALKTKRVKISWGEEIAGLLTHPAHPSMLKRIKRLGTLV
jgi:heat shock protein HtpX